MYPLLAKVPKTTSTLCEQFRTILLTAGHVAAGDATSAAAAFKYISKNLQDKAYELTILQAAPFIGIPRVLHSAASLQSTGVTGNQSKSLQAFDYHSEYSSTRSELRRRGEDTFQTIYGRNANRVRRRLNEFHPALDDWIVTCTYGALLSKAAAPDMEISLRERELCAVAVLCVDPCASVQLASHLRGALKAGASVEEVRAVIGQTEVVCGQAAAQSAEAVWATYERARYAL